jgi:hypothetical protein
MMVALRCGMTDAEIDFQNRLLWWLWTGEWRDNDRD